MRDAKIGKPERGRKIMNKAIMFILLGAFLIGLPVAAAYTTTVSNIVKPTSYSTVRTDAVSVAATDVKEVKRNDASITDGIVVASPRNIVHQNSVVTSAKPQKTVEKAPSKVLRKERVVSNEKNTVSEKRFRKQESIEVYEPGYASLNITNYTGQNNTNGTWIEYCKGDINMDGRVNAFDIDPFVSLLGESVSTDAKIANIYWSVWVGDFDNDWDVDFDDIDPFVETLVGKRKLECKTVLA